MIGETAGTGTHFYECLRYNAREKNRQGEKKCEWVEYRNLNANDAEMAAHEMIMTADQRRANAKDPLHHFVIAWHEKDNPTKEQMLKVADRWMEHMGLEDRQAQIASHIDKPYSHIHLAVNRVHPETHKSWPTWKFKTKSQTIIKEFEQEFGWEIVPGKLHPQLGIEINGRSPEAWEFHAEQRLNKASYSIGVDPDSVDGRNIIDKCEEIKDQLWEVYDKGKDGSFKEFDNVLDKRGLWVEMARNEKGMLIYDGRYHVKASDVQRQFSGPNLEKTFGESLNDYIHAREETLNLQSGIRLAMDWKEALDEREQQMLDKILVSDIASRQARVKELKELDEAFSSQLNELEEEIVDEVSRAYKDTNNALGRIQEYLDSHERPENYITLQRALQENPAQFGEVYSQQNIQYLVEIFAEAEKLQGEYGNYFAGENKKARLKEIDKEASILKERMSIKGTIKGKLGAKARQKLAEGSEAGKAAADTYNKSLMLYRSLNTIYRFFVNDRPIGRNRSLDQQMANALANINESINKAYKNPIEVKRYFDEITWNNYQKPQDGIDAIAMLAKEPERFGALKDPSEIPSLAEWLRTPEEIRANHADFLRTLGNIGTIDAETGKQVWAGRWLVWREQDAPSLNVGEYEGSTQTIDQLLEQEDDFLEKVAGMDIPRPLQDIIAKRAEGIPLDEIFAEHEAFIRRQGTPKDLTEYFNKLPDVIEREPGMVGTLSAAQEVSRWIGQGMSGTEAGRVMAKATQIGFKLAKSLSGMLASSSGAGKDGIRSIIKDSVRITKVSALEHVYGRSKSKSRGRDQGVSR